jgi:hypothetical protein
MSSANGTKAFGSPDSSEMYLSDTPTVPSSSSLMSPHPASLVQERVSFRPPPTRPDSPDQSQTEQSSDVLQAIVISFPSNLNSTPTSIDVSEPGLLGKKVSRLYELIDPQAGYSASNSSLIFGNAYMNYERTLSDYGIISGDTIFLNPRPTQRVKWVCRKPVIYLYPPSSLPDVTVELALTSSWRFSAVHPLPQTTVPPGEPHTAQSLT